VENSGGSQASGNHLDALSARGHSISSGSVASGISSNSLARDFSVRSENVTANRMLSFKIGSKHVGKGGLQRDTTKSARLAAGDGNSSMEEISDISGISGEMDYLNPNATSNCPKRRRSTAITEKFGAFLSPWGKRSSPRKLYP
jgi:hypothetical protein